MIATKNSVDFYNIYQKDFNYFLIILIICFNKNKNSEYVIYIICQIIQNHISSY